MGDLPRWETGIRISMLHLQNKPESKTEKVSLDNVITLGDIVRADWVAT
jgi:hypothetical protein